MSRLNALVRATTRLGTRQLICAGVFTLALAGSVGLGVASRNLGSAATVRDCSHNSIDYAEFPHSGDCGAATPSELIADIQHNDPTDLANVYAKFGLTASNYTAFANSAQQGVINRDGTVVVNGQTVMTNAFTLGRDNSDSHRQEMTINGKKYYYSAPQYSFASGVQSLDVMVLFDNRGMAIALVMNSCGNTVGGTPVTSDVTCKTLDMTQPDETHQPNTYDFTTSAALVGNATLDRVVYTITDGSQTTTVTKHSLSDQVEHTFAANGKVTVTVFAKVPGNHVIQSVTVASCAHAITFVPPFFVCTNLQAVALDDQKKSFRFTVIARTDSTGTTTLQDIDFTLDAKTTAKNVVTKDAQGNIYQEYTFTDDIQHTVKASLNFNTAQGVQSVTCQAKVTPAQAPKCTVPGHTSEAPNSPTCGYCQPNIPIGDTRCTPPTPPTTPPKQLTDTGPGTTAATAFMGTVIFGFFAHKAILGRRARRAAADVAVA